MMIATLHDSLPLFGYAALLLVASAVPLALARMTLRSDAARTRFGRVGRRVVAGLIVIAGAPVYVYAGLLLLLAIAAIGCAPDAYECPV